MTSYHQAAYTLDSEIPEDEAPLSAGHDPEDAEKVKELSDTFREGREEQEQAQADKDREFAERDPKPTPSQLEVERGLVPVPEDSEADTSDDSEVPDGTTQDVLDWVGDDSDRAQQALDAEQARDTPRTTLVAELERRTERTA